MHRPLLGLGLVIGLFLGCQGPSGVDGLCDLLHACGSANFDDMADCVDSINKCDGADDRAQGCINRNGCDEHNACARDLARDCADDTPAPTGAAASTGEPTTGSPPEETTAPVDPTTTGPFDPGTSTPDDTTTSGESSSTSETSLDPSEGDLVEQCKMKATPPTACSDCACESCREQTEACRADAGCTAIRKCAQDNDCSGVGCLGPCGPTIDMHGGFGGPSAQLALDLSGCVEQSCAAPCEG